MHILYHDMTIAIHSERLQRRSAQSLTSVLPCAGRINVVRYLGGTTSTYQEMYCYCGVIRFECLSLSTDECVRPSVCAHGACDPTYCTWELRSV